MSAFPHEWLNLHLWPLLLLALVPLLIHWLDRRRAPTVDWPGIRFLLVGGERAIRRLERRDLILLVVRTIAIAAILIATLRPRAEMAPGPLLGPGRAATVVVLDTSLSMTARSPSSSERRFDRARNAALRVLERLGPEDLVRVVPLPAADVAQPTDPLPPDAARQIVRAITPGGAGFDISEALRIGIEEVSALPAAERAVWIFTDLEPPPSGQDLSARRELLRRFVADLDPPPAVHLVDAGDPDAWNVAITALEPEGIALGTDEPA
ncbi:MAG TPA: vWA domain-containing protein, partial [Planctomycetota bacterium]|nr:vWA domain-containing protein [Planctomycetota bacterium]